MGKSFTRKIGDFCDSCKAEYKKLEDGTWFGEIPGFRGAWANGEVLEVCRMELMEVLKEWLLLKIKDEVSKGNR